MRELYEGHDEGEEDDEEEESAEGQAKSNQPAVPDVPHVYADQEEEAFGHAEEEEEEGNPEGLPDPDVKALEIAEIIRAKLIGEHPEHAAELAAIDLVAASK